MTLQRLGINPAGRGLSGGDQALLLRSQIPHHLHRFHTLHGTKKYAICSFCAIHEDTEASTRGIMSYRVYMKLHLKKTSFTQDATEHI